MLRASNVNQMKSSQQRISGTTLFTRFCFMAKIGIWCLRSLLFPMVLCTRFRVEIKAWLAFGMCGIGWSFGRTSRSVCAFALWCCVSWWPLAESWGCLVSTAWRWWCIVLGVVLGLVGLIVCRPVAESARSSRGKGACLIDLTSAVAYVLPTGCMEFGIGLGMVVSTTGGRMLFTELKSPSDAAVSDHQGCLHRALPRAT